LTKRACVPCSIAWLHHKYTSRLHTADLAVTYFRHRTKLAPVRCDFSASFVTPIFVVHRLITTLVAESSDWSVFATLLHQSSESRAAAIKAPRICPPRHCPSSHLQSNGLGVLLIRIKEHLDFYPRSPSQPHNNPTSPLAAKLRIRFQQHTGTISCGRLGLQRGSFLPAKRGFCRSIVPVTVAVVASVTMSITRAFTTRRVKQSLEAAEEAKVQRRSSNGGAPGSMRFKISAPVELIHTTNMLSYNAPDIRPRNVSDSSTASPSSASTKSDEDSDAHTVASTPPTSPDVPSMNLAAKLEANHLSSYFTAPPEVEMQMSMDRKPSARTGSVRAAVERMEAPAIPQRSPSHTKKPLDAPNFTRSPSARLSEQSARSASTKAHSTFSRASSSSSNTAITSRSSASASHPTKVSTSSIGTPTVPVMPGSPPQVQQHRKELSGSRNNPFGQELAQVSELAEEFSIATKAEISAASKAMLEEEQVLQARDLHKFSAEDYMSDIRELASRFFGEIKPAGPVWI
jgi:hypothetical protein